MIYLDNAATSFPKPPETIAAIEAALAAPASPGRSGHAASLNASRSIHQARKNIAKLFGLKDNSRLAFTANITWAINVALEGLNFSAGDHILTGPLEHNALARPLHRLVKERGIVWEQAPLNEAGVCEPEAFKKLLRPQTRLVALGQASNVSGALMPAAEIKEAIGDIPILLDTAQTAGALPLDDLGLWADIICFTGHKSLLGPTGTGGLWLRPGLELRPLALGGTGSVSESLEPPDFLPDALEPGTANVHGLAGLAAGVEIILRAGTAAVRAHEMDLTMAFLEGLEAIEGLKVYGPRQAQLRVATVSVSLEGWSSSALASALEREAGILTRAGLHCAPLAHQSLGSFPGGLTRFSFGLYNTRSEVDITLDLLRRLARSRPSQAG